MIYGNNVRLEKENDNREVRCRLLMKKTTAAAEYEVSSGLNYWQFANAAVAVMRKKDRVFDLFYFPCRNLTGPLVCGPRDVFEFKLFGADFVYHLTDGWFWLNHRPGKQKLENGREMFLGDVYLGKKILAGDVFGERPESGGWNVSALDEETDAFETRKYVSFTPAADGKTSIAQYPDGRCDLFCDGYRIKAGPQGGYRKLQVRGGSVLLFAAGDAWKKVYEGSDCLPENFDLPAVLVYDRDSDKNGTLILFDGEKCVEEHGEIELFDRAVIAVGNKVFDADAGDTFFAG